MSETQAATEQKDRAAPRHRLVSDLRLDADLMTRVAQGDVEAFSVLVERHLPALFRLCSRLLGDRHEAEDLTQESLSRLWQCAPNWRSSAGGVPAWLHRVATNLCLDRLRRRRELVVDELPELTDATPSAVQQMQLSELEAGLETCLTRLPDHHRAALLLSYYEGYSNALAAQIMDMNLKAFESLLVRARRRMADELQQSGIVGADLAILA